MSNEEGKIIKALQTATLTAVNKVFPVKCLNVNMNPPANGKWWEIIYIPNNISNELWDVEGQTYRGVLRLILHWPQDNTGVYKAIEEAARVADALKKGSNFDDVRIIDRPAISNVIEDSPNLIIALTIRYQCFII